MKLLKKVKFLLTFLFAFAVCFGFSNKVFAARWIGSGECYRTWYINVNKPIDPATLTSKNVRVYDDKNNDINVKVDVYNSTSIRITPNDKGYTAGHTIYISLSVGIKSIFGEDLNLGDYALNYFTVTQDTEATVSDSTLNTAARRALNKPVGKLMQSDLDRISELSISNNYGNANIDFNDIFKFHNLSKVTFYNSSFTNLNNISTLVNYLKNIKSFYALDLSNNKIGSNISPLIDLFANTNIRNLDLSNTGISDISHLNRLTNLNTVDLSNNNISNVYSLGTLKLREAYLSNNSISDITNLKNNTMLTILDLSDNNVLNLSPLNSLTNLVKLNLSGNNTSGKQAVGGYDISPISTLVNLESLDLSSNNLQNIDPLEDLSKMKDINLSSNGIQDISGLKNMDVLQNLNLAGNRLISDISVIKNLENIVSINLGFNQVRELNALSNLNKLTDLNLEYNKIVDLTPLQDLSQLQKLKLNDNSITNIYPLITLTNLNTLYLKDNGKFDPVPLTNLNNISDKDF